MSAVLDPIERRREVNRRYRERNIERERERCRSYHRSKAPGREKKADAALARFIAGAEAVEAEWVNWIELEDQEVASRFAKVHGVNLSVITGPSRKQIPALCRMQLASVLRRIFPNYGLEWLGAVLGGRDHTTALHSVRVWPERAAKLGIPVDLEAVQ